MHKMYWACIQYHVVWATCPISRQSNLRNRNEVGFSGMFSAATSTKTATSYVLITCMNAECIWCITLTFVEIFFFGIRDTLLYTDLGWKKAGIRQWPMCQIKNAKKANLIGIIKTSSNNRPSQKSQIEKKKTAEIFWEWRYL